MGSRPTPPSASHTEYVVWSADGTKVYTCLQENSAIATIDVPASGTPSAAAIKALTLKDWTSSGYKVDTNKDDEDCVLEYKPSFYSMRNPDSIATVTVDGTDYLVRMHPHNSRGRPTRG